MKKTQIIALVVISLIVIFGVFFYFYYYDGQDEELQVAEQGENQAESVNNNTEKTPDEIDNTDSTKENTDRKTDDTRLKEEENKTGAEEEKEVKVLTVVHNTPSYRRSFRNPFKDYRIGSGISGEAISIEAIKELVPFKLKGIIGNNYGRLAVVEHNSKTRIIREKTVIDDFWIIDILDNELVIVYKGIQFKLEMESGILEEL